MIYLILGDGFEEIEAVTVIDILRRGGKSLQTVSVSDTLCVTGSHNIKITADIMIDEADASLINCIILPGGEGGVASMEKSDAFTRLLDEAVSKDCFICAICAAPKILGERGFLKGKKATCYPGYEQYFNGGIYKGTKTYTDGKLITGNGPGAAFDFAYEILRALGTDPTELIEGMQYAQK